MASTSGARPSRAIRRRPRRWLWPAVVGGVALLTGLFALVLTHQPAATGGAAAAGMVVPNVALPSTAGHPISLADYRGKKVVLYFYEGST